MSTRNAVKKVQQMLSFCLTGLFSIHAMVPSGLLRERLGLMKQNFSYTLGAILLPKQVWKYCKQDVKVKLQMKQYTLLQGEFSS